MLEGLLGGAQAVQLQHPAVESLCLLLEQHAAAANLVADSTSDRLSQDTAAMAIQEASQVGPSLSLFLCRARVLPLLCRPCQQVQTVAPVLPAMGSVLCCRAQGLPDLEGTVESSCLLHLHPFRPGHPPAIVTWSFQLSNARLQACRLPPASPATGLCLLGSLWGSLLSLRPLFSAAAARQPAASASEWLRQHLSRAPVQNVGSMARAAADLFGECPAETQQVGSCHCWVMQLCYLDTYPMLLCPACSII